ncbi:MAG: hypothetical protein ACE5KE_00235 [Methanosarcinales archaeon]
MVLFAIVGELGSGKTLALTYLAWLNWYKKKRKIFSNYSFYGFPYTPIKNVTDLDSMKSGFFAGDELWLWVDSRTSKKERNRFVASILLKSRKRDITIAYTSQAISQIDKRIRQITDFIAYPLMSVDNRFCRIEVFRGPRPAISTRIKPPIYFVTEPVYAMFNTYEEVNIIEEESKKLHKEVTIPITKNPAWIRYLKEIGVKNIERYSKRIYNAINGIGMRIG